MKLMKFRARLQAIDESPLLVGICVSLIRSSSISRSLIPDNLDAPGLLTAWRLYRYDK